MSQRPVLQRAIPAETAWPEQAGDHLEVCLVLTGGIALGVAGAWLVTVAEGRALSAITASWTCCSGAGNPFWHARKVQLSCMLKATPAGSFRPSFGLSGRRPDQLVIQGFAGRSQRAIVHTGLLEEAVLIGGPRWPGRLRPGELLPPAAEEGVEGLGHNVRGARAAASAGVGGMIAGPALCVGHDRSPREKSEDLTIPFPSFSPQGLTVSKSTHNAGLDNARSVNRLSRIKTDPVVTASLVFHMSAHASWDTSLA